MQLFNLANILTLINLISGCIAIVFAFNYQLDLVPVFIIVSLIADFLDGFAARLNKNSTEIGKQLDSLADVVSFGVVPGVIIFRLLFQLHEAGYNNYHQWQLILLASPAFLITSFAALRLAKFNVDTRQSEGFIGLATPAATLYVAGLLVVFLQNYAGLNNVVYNALFLYGNIATLCFLMIAELPMFSFKLKNWSWKENRVHYVFILISVALIAVFKFASLSFIIIVYILLSIIKKQFKL
jgi:CDP-diacylglycerol---serine O-phosphatidyltransferase